MLSIRQGDCSASNRDERAERNGSRKGVTGYVHNRLFDADRVTLDLERYLEKTSAVSGSSGIGASSTDSGSNSDMPTTLVHSNVFGSNAHDPHIIITGLSCEQTKCHPRGNWETWPPRIDAATGALSRSQQMVNLPQTPVSQTHLSLRCIACLLWSLTGCTLFSAQEVIQLKEAVRLHETQDDVRRRLGRPHFTKLLPDGQTVWLYQVWTNTGGDLNGPGTRYCDLYRLLFDEKATLREWRHEDC